VHTVIASYLTTALAVGAVGAWHLLRAVARDEARQAHARKMFSMAMWMAALVAPVQILVGDLHGLNTHEHQAPKVMAMEGHYQSHPDGAPLVLFGIPNDAEQRMEHAIEIPRLSSLILEHDLDAPLAGLDTVAPENRPPVKVVFWTFRVMVGLGFLMALLGACSLLARITGRLYNARWLLRFAIAMGPAGFVAVIAGWMTTEGGRQPFTIYGVLRTAESASPLAAPAVATSLIAFIIVYFAVFGMGTWYLLKLMSRAPQAHEPAPLHIPAHAAGITPGPALAGGVSARDPAHD
jgi:cytochrome d ubiquinol oxidase subunit I